MFESASAPAATQQHNANSNCMAYDVHCTLHIAYTTELWIPNIVPFKIHKFFPQFYVERQITILRIVLHSTVSRWAVHIHLNGNKISHLFQLFVKFANMSIYLISFHVNCMLSCFIFHWYFVIEFIDRTNEPKILTKLIAHTESINNIQIIGKSFIFSCKFYKLNHTWFSIWKEKNKLRTWNRFHVFCPQKEKEKKNRKMNPICLVQCPYAFATIKIVGVL